jgi:predicted alpha/beta-fold hydrolase
LAIPESLFKVSLDLRHFNPELVLILLRRLGSNLVTLHKRHLKTLQKWPDHPVTQAVTTAASLKSAPHIREFDDLVTRIAGGTRAPHGPFPYETVYDVRSDQSM